MKGREMRLTGSSKTDYLLGSPVIFTDSYYYHQIRKEWSVRDYILHQCIISRPRFFIPRHRIEYIVYEFSNCRCL